MNVTPLSSGNFSTLVEREGIVLVDCRAPWCGGCRESAPAFERVARELPEHVFATLDTDLETGLVERLGIRHVPTLLLFRDGYLLFKQPGSMDEPGLRDVVAQAEALDMDVVRAHLERELESA